MLQRWMNRVIAGHLAYLNGDPGMPHGENKTKRDTRSGFSAAIVMAMGAPVEKPLRVGQ